MSSVINKTTLMEIKFQKNPSTSNLSLFKEVVIQLESLLQFKWVCTYSLPYLKLPYLKYKMIKRDMKWALKQKAQTIESLSENEN